MSFIAIIPARFVSKRLPGKPLVDINGKPMVVRVMERAQASGADRVITATDHVGVVEAIKSAGGEVCLTSPDHQSGTERLQEVIDYYDFPDNQIIVNVQGDEPLIPPQIIKQVADNLAFTDAGIATLAVPIITSEEAFNPNVVKVVVDASSYALYFSRATIPWDREGFARSRDHLYHNLLRHIGIYAYRASFIRRYVSWSISPLEQIEVLEQLRILWHGEKIHVAIASATPSMGVDTPEELLQVRLLQQKIN
ncbi:3-deoxy-manno-octulosonate cytidylyltransferase [Sodalis endosymbiont of Henestaris halophilus]|uniref:3-deoxy-manno-octulosonate cytidylyltransferase n=1 Tax=Sodalis endosymbiont of Henestaris halophilus TaxID=1929246 RepID=UPI000BBF7239|nr:3-deoxy-manno-octulosonate cytidylyltransferase [Sodalis endosymbiont of Henestaris halophilus]SNC59125.1 3-deoxy-manno-octulosonate cytidylyltransferase [Sodalis endosymbiont of Henestaris halophilus]